MSLNNHVERSKSSCSQWRRCGHLEKASTQEAIAVTVIVARKNGNSYCCRPRNKDGHQTTPTDQQANIPRVQKDRENSSSSGFEVTRGQCKARPRGEGLLRSREPVCRSFNRPSITSTVLMLKPSRLVFIYLATAPLPTIAALSSHTSPPPPAFQGVLVKCPHIILTPSPAKDDLQTSSLLFSP